MCQVHCCRGTRVRGDMESTLTCTGRGWPELPSGVTSSPRAHGEQLRAQRVLSRLLLHVPTCCSLRDLPGNEEAFPAASIGGTERLTSPSPPPLHQPLDVTWRRTNRSALFFFYLKGTVERCMRRILRLWVALPAGL